MTERHPLTDAELDARLRAAGAALDAAAARRVAGRDRRRRPGSRAGGRRAVLVAAAVLVVLVVGAAVLATTGGGPAPDARIAPTDPPPSTTEPALDPATVRALGASGTIVTRDALVDLATGRSTPVVGAGNPLTETVAVPDGEGGTYYLSFAPGPVPSDPAGSRMDLRHVGPEGDVVVEAGARSFARRADGALAVAVPLDPIIRNPDTGLVRIVVVEPGGDRTTWTTEAGAYAVTAWAGERLLVGRSIEDTEADDLVVLDGPDRLRDLGSYADVHAVGPDGSWALVTRLPVGAARDDGAPPPAPEVVDLATGAPTGTVEIDPSVRLGRVTWDGPDRLVAAGHLAPDAPVIALLAVAEDGAGSVTVEVTEVVVLGPETFGPTVAWAGPDGSVMALAHSSDQQYLPRLPVCPPDRVRDRCVIHELPEDLGPLPDLVDDPSRPAS